MRIAIGCDHAGLALKAMLATDLAAAGHAVEDVGTVSEASVDYVDFGAGVARMVRDGACDRGILVCGTGQGMAMTANKHRGVRASLCHDPVSARFARLHNDANVLALGARIIGPELAREVVRVWLATPYEGGRHDRRLAKLKAIEEGQ